MRIEQLLYFVEISKTHSISLAADNLFVSQPAVSAAIKKLEEELGVTLFTRSKNGVNLTAIGEQIMTEVQAILVHAKNMNSMVNQHKYIEYASLQGLLRLHVPPAVGNWLLPKIMPAFKNVFPQITLDCIENNPEEIRMLCLNRDYDFHVFSTIDPDFEKSIPELVSQQPESRIDFLTNCKQIACVCAASPLAQKSSLSLKDLFELPLGCLSYSTYDFDFICRLFPEMSRPNIVFKCNSLSLLIDQIRMDNCVSVSASFQPPIPGITVIPISTPCNLKFFASYYVDNPLLPAIQFFLSLLKSCS